MISIENGEYMMNKDFSNFCGGNIKTDICKFNISLIITFDLRLHICTYFLKSCIFISKHFLLSNNFYFLCILIQIQNFKSKTLNNYFMKTLGEEKGVSLEASCRRAPCTHGAVLEFNFKNMKHLNIL